MEKWYVIPLSILLGAALLVGLILKFSRGERVADNLIKLALGCVVLSFLALSVQASLSGEAKDVVKLSGPTAVLLIVLVLRRKRRQSQRDS